MTNSEKLQPQTAASPTVRVRRGYFECRFGQLHVHHAMPAGGGFDEGTPLLALHAAGRSGAMFAGLLGFVGRNRSAFAPDLPGFGNSDASARLSIGEQAAAVSDFLDTMRLRKVDVLGCGFGAHVALELAASHSAVRRIVIAALPAPDTPMPPQSPQSADPYLQELWAAARADCGPDASLATLMSVCADRLRSGHEAADAALSERRDALHERVGTLSQALFVLHADAWPHGFESLAKQTPASARHALRGDGSLFHTAPQTIAVALEDFLNA